MLRTQCFSQSLISGGLHPGRMHLLVNEAARDSGMLVIVYSLQQLTRHDRSSPVRSLGRLNAFLYKCDAHSTGRPGWGRLGPT